MTTRWMTILSLGIALLLVGLPARAHESKLDRNNCTYNGKPLYGKVQIVDVFPDIKVQVVNAFPDLQVQTVDVFPDKCGQWQFVTVFPDLKVQYVNVFPDIQVQFVNAFPGLK